MHEIVPVKELSMIPVNRETPPAETRPEKKDPKPIRQKRDRTIRRWALVCAGLLAVCILQWIAIWLMLPSVF